MTDVEAIDSYAQHSGFTMRGVTRIPSHPWMADGQASNPLILLLRQASKVRNAKSEHDLRNLTGIRGYWKA